MLNLKITCDNCKVEKGEDFVGWINFHEMEIADIAFLEKKDTGSYDFCSFPCLIKYIDNRSKN